MSEITMDFARQDDCLDRMVPSDLRQVVGERDTLREQVSELEGALRGMVNKATKQDWNEAYPDQLEAAFNALDHLKGE